MYQLFSKAHSFVIRSHMHVHAGAGKNDCRNSNLAIFASIIPHATRISRIKTKISQTISLFENTIFRSTVYGCPTSCTCGNLEFDYRNSNLTTFPSNTPHAARIVKLKGIHCSNCRMNIFKDFLNYIINLRVSGVMCEDKLLVNHNFTYCKGIIIQLKKNRKTSAFI